MKRYFLTDLDGTLLRKDQTVSKFSEEIIHRALENGHIISYATARSFTSSKDVTKNISWPYPVVLYNGALVYDHVSKTIIDGYFLDAATSNELISIGRSLDLCPMLFALDKESNEKVYHETISEVGYQSFYDSRPGDDRFEEVSDLVCHDNTQAIVLTYIGYKDVLEVKSRKVKYRRK